MRILYVFDWWESFVAVGEGFLAELAAAAIVASYVWLLRRRRRRRSQVDQAIAARLTDDRALQGVPLRMKVAIYQRMGPATAEATRVIMGRTRVSREVAAVRAEKAVNNTIAWLLTMYHDAGRLGRLRVAIEFPFLFKVCVAHQIMLQGRRSAPELVGQQALWAVF